MRTMMLMVAAALAVLPATARAEDACAHPKTAYDKTYCTAKLFLASDDELNATYKELRGQLSKQGQHKLLEAQRAWLKYRDAKCSTGGKIDVQCNFDVNKSRTDFLRDRSRECKVGHCREDLVSQTSWTE